MPNITVGAKARHAAFHAVIHRADGTIEDLGMIAYYHCNPIRRWVVNAAIFLKRKLNDCSNPK